MGISGRRTQGGEHVVEFINHSRASVAVEALEAYLFDPLVEGSPRLKLSLL